MPTQFTFPGTSLTVNRIGYGAMQLAGPGVFGPPKDPVAAVAVLREAVAAGVNHIDTSDYYGPHVTNQIIRQALHPYPADLVIVTKLGGRRPPDGSWQPAISPQELTAGVHDNLRNLGLDVLDIVNYRVMGLGHGTAEGSIAEQVLALADLRRQGLIRHIGVSNATAAQLAEAQSITDIVCVQNNYNLAHREDDDMIDDLAAAGIAYVPFFPLGGFTPLQSSTLSSVASRLGAHADAGRTRVAAAAVAQHSADPRHVVGRAPARESRRRQFVTVAATRGRVRRNRRRSARLPLIDFYKDGVKSRFFTRKA
jgi:pyridoxine 4-dehydrogenase